jgi:hypothetical protein
MKPDIDSLNRPLLTELQIEKINNQRLDDLRKLAARYVVAMLRAGECADEYGLVGVASDLANRTLALQLPEEHRLKLVEADDESERCEGCGAVATQHDSESVPLCDDCMNGLKLENIQEMCRRGGVTFVECPECEEHYATIDAPASRLCAECAEAQA